MRCNNCDCEIDNCVVINSGLGSQYSLCPDCFEAAKESEEIIFVSNHNGWYDEDETVYAADTNAYELRYDCIMCDDCGEWYYNDEYVHSDADGNCICDDCWNRFGYAYCDVCGAILSPNEQCWHDDNCYCEDCEPEDVIESYSNEQLSLEYDGNEFRSIEDENDDIVEYFGVELEVESSRNRNSSFSRAAERVVDLTDLVHTKRDGSLTDGFEIVSVPATLRYHKERIPWERVQEICRECGMVSHNSHNCGLHIHVSREAFGEGETEQDLHIAILMMLQRKFSDKFHTFSRRGSEHYCRDNMIDITEADTYSVIKSKVKAQERERYLQINVSNEYTVEFRCFKGTLIYKTLIASLEFVATLVRYCTQITIRDVESVEWEDIFANTEYPTLKNYMMSKGLL